MAINWNFNSAFQGCNVQKVEWWNRFGAVYPSDHIWFKLDLCMPTYIETQLLLHLEKRTICCNMLDPISKFSSSTKSFSLHLSRAPESCSCHANQVAFSRNRSSVRETFAMVSHSSEHAHVFDVSHVAYPRPLSRTSNSCHHVILGWDSQHNRTQPTACWLGQEKPHGNMKTGIPANACVHLASSILSGCHSMWL